MRRMTILVLAMVGCQEYGFVPPPENTELPPESPPDVPTEPAIPVAEQKVYANTFDTLFDVDPVTGQRNEIGQFHLVGGGQAVEGIEDIAIDNDGQVFGGVRDGTIYQIDPTTAEVEVVCDTSARMLGMAFTPSGDLLAAGQNVIHQVDLTTCAAAPVVINTDYVTSGDIVGLPDGFIYWTVKEEDDFDGLVRIDPTTWFTQYLGSIPVSGLFGVGYADDQLFGFSRNGETVSIVPEPAAQGGFVSTTVLRTDSSIQWWGATTNPVAW